MPPHHPRPADPLASILRVLLVLGALLAPGLREEAGAQEVENPMTPAGRLRIEMASGFTSWNRRFGPEGSEPLGTDLSDETSAGLVPGADELESALRDLLQDPSYQAVLGRSETLVSQDRTRLPFGLDVGIFDWLSVGVTVPLVKSRTEITLLYEGQDAALGLNPAVASQSEVLAFFDALGTAQAAAEAQVGSVCAEQPDSPECLAAQSARQEVSELTQGLQAAYSASPLFPTGASEAGTALVDRVGQVSAALEAAGLSPIGSTLPLAADAITDAEAFNDLLQNPSAGFAMPPLEDRVGQWQLGDVELRAAFRLLEGATRDSTGNPRTRWQIGAGAMVRLGTGTLGDPGVPYDLGSGDGQTDVEGRLFAMLESGRFGLWADARRGVQGATQVLRRVAPPDVVLAPRIDLAVVEWTPGNYTSLELAPRYHLSDALSLTASYRVYRKGADSYRRLEPVDVPDLGPLPTGKIYADASVLAEETEETLHQFGLGLVLSTLELWREGRAPAPLEGRLRVRSAVGGSGGRTPDGLSVEAGIRLYMHLWGDEPGPPAR